MEVGKITQNYLNPKRTVVKNNSPQSFTGNIARVGQELGQDLIDIIPAKKAVNFLNKFEWLRSELGTIIITALGTGLVAPIFIGFNPLVKAPKDASKEEKENVKNDKLYKALRQPVSAVLAVLFQVGALIPIEKYLDNQFNDPKNSKNVAVDIDQSLVNSEKYLKRKIKKEMKSESTIYPDDEAFKAELNKRLEARKQSQLDTVAEQIKNTGSIDVNGRKFPDNYIAEIANQNIDNYIMDVKSHHIDDAGLEFYKNRAKLLVENEDYLKQSFSNIPHDNARAYLKEEMQKAPEELKVIFKEILEHNDDLMESRCTRTLERIEKIHNVCDGEFTPDKYLEKMISDNAIVDDIVKQLEDSKIEDVSKSDSSVIKRTLEKLTNICSYDKNTNKQVDRIFHDTEILQNSKDGIIHKINLDMAKGYKEFIEKGFKGFKQVSTLLIGVAITLPITCTALNKIYPGFIETFFPKIAGVKKEGGNNEPSK